MKLEWVVHAQAGAAVEVIARHERAGVVRRKISLA
jgi:hypothetical protein